MSPHLATSLVSALSTPASFAARGASAPPLRLGGEDLPVLLESRLRAAEPVFAAVYGVRAYVDGVFGAIALAVIVAALVLALSGRMRIRAPWRYALLGVLAGPAASWLAFLLTRRPTTGAQVVGGLVAAWALVWGAAAALAWVGGPRRALATLLLGTSAVVLVDQWLGGTLAVGVLGYSPLDGARFYGLGNEGAAILFASALVGGTVALEAHPPGPRRRMLAAWSIPLLGAVVVLTAAAPALGANFTVALWGTLGFAVAVVGASERRFGLREAAVGLAGALALLAAVAALDLARGGAGTHAARALRDLTGGGGSDVARLLAAKAAINLRILVTMPGGVFVPPTVAGLGYALWRPRPRLAAILQARPVFAAGLRGALAGAALAMVTEDSGVLIGALVLVFVGGALAYVAALPAAEARHGAVAPEAPARPASAEEVGE